MIIDLDDVNLVGCHSPDPISTAFVRKASAHAGGQSTPISEENVQFELTRRLKQQGGNNRSRCLYVHIPFCRVRCTFCNFFQYASSKNLIENYFQALLAELRWKSQFEWTQSQPFHAVYIGGGTPTDLSAEQLEILGKTIRHLFPLTSDCELTLEGRLNGFNSEKFERALEGGFNRFSFGIQSFNSKVRRAAKRLDDREYVLNKVQELVRYNAAPIVLDLLYGLPHQTLDIWEQDLNDYVVSGAHGVDLYQLIEMKGFPMAQLVEKGKLPAPADTALKARMYQFGVQFMDQHHQKRLSVNHWASSNRERSIYNSLAKTTAEVLPLGAGAGGNIGGIQMMHTRDMGAYIEAVTNQKFPTEMAFEAPITRGISAEVKSAFDQGVLAKHRLDSLYGETLFEALRPLFSAWQNNGLVNLEKEYLTLTVAGQFWSVTLAQNLIEVIENNYNLVRAA
ncbi:heme anaerobic degradation radical SAM methyltransferase ChuW/HutW [Vibrio sp. DW001]|uniref:heme anaerobic degradation radical SAM methyltransferase ChuW/HutW n=1 Tax=Vibrio sp. DW001 TaxID=2912315 RepID=UPI0023AECAF1|nr:heme anaerobic degradation radical SAM methyltransferase ChuW/HutW [Vibrio sp. DW001]WED27672.1 heme anaerobic degradation radical SAM methyltransferase ChuW/HutW [Vibrio sp. DW001]